MDPDGDGADDDIRIHADVNPPNGLLGGAVGICDEDNEDLTIAYDADNMTITRRDNNTDMAAMPMTEPVITSLVFEYLDSARNVTANPNAVAYVRVRVTGQSATKQNLYQGEESDFTTTTLETEVHLRTR